VLRTRLKVIALTCLLATAVLASAVAHDSSPYAFEDAVLAWLGPPSAVRSWAHLVELLGAPAVCAVLFASFALGVVRRAFFRVAVYTMFAAAALLISEHVAKPLVQRTYNAELTFPSGHVTAVSATALAMWLALYPLLGKRARGVTLVLGALWHTPLDAVGSILLSVGIVTGGAAVFEPAGTRRPFMSPRGGRGGER
jgi:membrane-associated phospholipid phosphatase